MNLLYIISQLFVIIQYFFLMMTYQSKKKKQIIFFNTLSAISAIVSFLLLGAYSGCMMSCLSLFRNYLFSRKEKNDNSKLITIIILLLILTIITYDGLFSLMPVIGTLLYTISIWQNNTITYKKMGVLIEMSWFIYYIYIKSLFGIILESILLASVIIGLIFEISKGKKYEKCK